MQRHLFLLAFTFLSFNTIAQYGDDVDKIFNEAYALSKQNKPREAVKGFQRVLDIVPSHVNAHIMMSWCHLITGDVSQATMYADNALQMDHYYDVPYLSKAYAAYATGDPQAPHYLQTYAWITADPAAQQNLVQDCNDLISAGIKPEIFTKVRDAVPTLFRMRDPSFQTIQQGLNDASKYLSENNINSAIVVLDKTSQRLGFSETYSYMTPAVLFQIGKLLEYHGHYAYALAVFEMAIAEMPKHKNISPYTRTVLATKIASYYYRNMQEDKMEALLSSYLRHARALPAFAAYEKGEFLTYLCRSIGEKVDKREQLIEYATLLSEVTHPDFTTNSHFKAYGHMYLGHAFQTGRTSAERAKAKSAFETALQYAQRANLEQEEADVKGLFSTYHFSQGDYETSMRLMLESIDFAVKQNDFLTAQVRYNNLGAMYYGAGDFKNAVKVFRIATDAGEKFRGQLQGELKLNYMAQIATTYNFLVSSLAQLGDRDGLFEAQNLERGRVLSELLANNNYRRKVTLKEYQSLLQADEASIIYTQMFPGQIIANVITKTSSEATTITNMELFVGLKRKYLDAINKAADKPGYKPTIENSNDIVAQLSQDDMDDMMQLCRKLLQSNASQDVVAKNEFLRSYYDFLLAPIESKLRGLKKLIIMPDGLLNFIPFEALKTPGGKYLVEEYDVRYVQSPEVKSIIASRTYGPRAKGLLAMGGAQYENMTETSERIRGVDKMLELQSRAHANSISERPQRDIYAALGFANLSYLPGTLAEVKQIEKYFKGNSDVFTGTDMTENRLKSMSRDGSLKKYKIIHLATHGFAVPQIPQLSGLAMCIFPDMQGQEDGFLTAPEIAKLNMNADVAVLSACETGLGKIYGGEGVSGLTQSLLIGGANAAIVSLWPVSDEGTMHFMTGLYDLTERQSMSHAEAVNLMKRRFIKGEFGPAFQSSEIWAPFVHYGK